LDWRWPPPPENPEVADEWVGPRRKGKKSKRKAL